MQPLTLEQRAVLTAPVVEISAGCELLNADLTVRADITPDLAGGTVERNMDGPIHGTCTLNLFRRVKWGIDRLRVFMVLTDVGSGVSARFNVGAFVLTTPKRQIGEIPEVFSASGYDLTYLLNRQVGTNYTVAAGTTYRQALLDAFAAAGLPGTAMIEGAAADNALPRDRTWALVGRSTDPDQTNTPATWLRILNDLQKQWNGAAVYTDHNGRYRCEAHREPAHRPVEWAFDADLDGTLVAEDRSLLENARDVPTRWVFRHTNRAGGLDPVEGNGLYTYNLPDSHPLSAANRGLVWTSVVDFEAASQAKLVELGDRKVAEDLRSSLTLDYPTAPFPAAGHGDVFEVRDSVAEVSVKVQATSWAFDLDGSDVRWTWEAV